MVRHKQNNHASRLNREYYSVAKLKGNSVLGYAIAHGDTFESEDVHWYRSPKLAKKFKKTHYKAFDFKITYNLDY